MQELKTRSARHHRPKRKMVINKKAIAPLIGTSLLVGPMMVTAVPQHVHADEQGSQTVADPQAFIDQIGWSASEVAASNDLYASVMIAQALLESAYGTSGLASAPNYNLFGVKGSYNGQVVYMATKEYVNGQWVTMNEPFRKYSLIGNPSKTMRMFFVQPVFPRRLSLCWRVEKQYNKFL